MDNKPPSEPQAYHFHIRIGRKPLKLALAVCIIWTAAYAITAEKFSMTTYYPSPVGVYKKLTTTSDTTLARDGGRVSIGTTAPTAELDINGAIRIRGGDPANRGAGSILWNGTEFQGDYGPAVGWKALGGGGRCYARITPGNASTTCACPAGWSKPDLSGEEELGAVYYCAWPGCLGGQRLPIGERCPVGWCEIPTGVACLCCYD